MSYEVIEEKLRSAQFFSSPNQYYSSVAEQLEPLLRNLTSIEERDALKEHLVRFVLRWYKDMTMFQPVGTEPPDPTDPSAISKFVNKAKAAGYDYTAEWDAVLKSFHA